MDERERAIGIVKAARGAVYPHMTCEEAYEHARADILRHLREGGLVPVWSERIKRVHAVRAVDQFALTYVRDREEFEKHIHKELGKRLGYGLIQMVPVTQRDITGEWPGPRVEFMAHVDVIMPKETK